MKEYLNKSFFLGFAAGVTVTLLVIYVGGSFLIQSLMDQQKIQASLQPPVFPGADADLEWAVSTLEGEELSLSELEGKILFINFWGVSCVPCRAEFPSLAAIYGEYADRDVEFLHVGLDEERKLKEYLNEHPPEFPIYLARGDIPATFRSGMVASKFIVDREGRIAYTHLGPAKWDCEETRIFLDALLGD